MAARSFKFKKRNKEIEVVVEAGYLRYNIALFVDGQPSAVQSGFIDTAPTITSGGFFTTQHHALVSIEGDGVTAYVNFCRNGIGICKLDMPPNVEQMVPLSGLQDFLG